MWRVEQCDTWSSRLFRTSYLGACEFFELDLKGRPSNGIGTNTWRQDYVVVFMGWGQITQFLGCWFVDDREAMLTEPAAWGGGERDVV